MNNPTKKMADALDQYRRLLSDCAAAIDRGTVAAIAPVRRAAAAVLSDSTCAALPHTGDEGYEYTSLRDMFAPDLGININRLPVTTDVSNIFHCGVPNISSLSGITVNDTFRPTGPLATRLPKGVTVTSFSHADANAAAIIAASYGTIAKATPDRPAVTLNTALAQDGILIHIAAGVTLDKPIQLVNILEAMTVPGTDRRMPVLATRRVLVVLEHHATARVLVCDHDRAADNTSVTSRVVEISLADNARLEWFELEESSGATGRYTHTEARMAADSHMQIFSGTLKSGVTRNNFVVHLDGPGADLRIDGMAIADDTQTADNSATVIHHAHHCTSNQTFKYLVADNAKGAFEGLIRVDSGAVGTEAYQNDRNLIASPGARMHARPQLEIYCDDVKCSHGAATGQLDARAMFYMQARGINRDEARSMLMNAFMSDVIDSVTLEPLRDRLKHLVERRLLGDDARCEGCNIC